MRSFLALLLAALPLAAAEAQPAPSGPSFDCAKAASPTEKAICASPAIAALDRRMADAYRALRGKLEGAPRDHLQADQTRWLRALGQACGSAPSDGARDRDDCLSQRYETRIARLATLGSGSYPFVGEQAVIRHGGKALDWLVDAAYPEFAAPGVDFGALNQSYAAKTTEAADSTRPEKGLKRGEPGAAGYYMQSFELERPAPEAVAVQIVYEGYAGGAHGFGGSIGSLVDLRHGRAVTPDAVFRDGWVAALAPLVTAKLAALDTDPECREIPDAAAFAKILAEPGHYYFRAAALEVAFQRYELGPYVCAPPTITLDYAALTGILRPDGLLASRRQ